MHSRTLVKHTRTAMFNLLCRQVSSSVLLNPLYINKYKHHIVIRVAQFADGVNVQKQRCVFDTPTEVNKEGRYQAVTRLESVW
jgi:hypothetical protein